MKNPFTLSTFTFLNQLSENNNRDWFNEHKPEYEEKVRTPALQFIEAMQDKLPSISSHFLASTRKSGGSLMRVYRDTRFSKDKTPYKTNIGIQFRHERGKDVHAPGFYVHIANDECFLGVGIWRPDSKSLGKIRDAIVESPKGWVKARDAKPFSTTFSLEGSSLKTSPRGFSVDHPLIEDLRRKDFIAIKPIAKNKLLNNSFLTETMKSFTNARPFMHYLCQALELQF
jgi:uncharacterized protein (TIGR02453 family)